MSDFLKKALKKSAKRRKKKALIPKKKINVEFWEEFEC